MLKNASKLIFIEIRSAAKVLMFHQVNDDRTAWKYPNCSITARSFEGLISQNYEKIQPIEKVGRYGGLFVTFDDAFGDVYENAVPVLRRYKVPFTIFMSVELLDEVGYLSTGQLVELASDPLCTIGSHSLHHCYFSRLSREEALTEMIKSKEFLESVTGTEIYDWAFPYGSLYACGFDTWRLVEKAGYRRGFSTISKTVARGSNEFFLPRVNINEEMVKKGSWE